MTETRFISSPGHSYIDAIEGVLRGARRFDLVTAFVTSAGIERVRESIGAVLAEGGSGSIYVAVDRGGFNTMEAFGALAELRREYRQELQIYLVAQRSGALLHAKLLLAEHREGDGALRHSLVLGSANLTSAALGGNHEAGVVVEPLSREARAAVRDFINLLPKSELPVDIPLPPARPTRGTSSTRPEGPFDRLPLAPPMPIEELDLYVEHFIHEGFFVGRGRSVLDAITVRFPSDQLAAQHLLRKPTRVRVGEAAYARQSEGHGVLLLPDAEDTAVRRELRRLRTLVPRLTLSLAAHGAWMPRSFWPVFDEARHIIEKRGGLDIERIIAAASARRAHLLDAGGLERAISEIVARLEKDGSIEATNAPLARDRAIELMKPQVLRRSPDVVASATRQRVERHGWSPAGDDQTDGPLRALLRDVVEAAFAPTFRTGVWPVGTKSFAARSLLVAIETRLGDADRDATAWRLLSALGGWDSKPFAEVLDEFRRLVPDDLAFVPPSIEDLLGDDNANAGSEDDDDD